MKHGTIAEAFAASNACIVSVLAAASTATTRFLAVAMRESCARTSKFDLLSENGVRMGWDENGV